MSQKRTDVHMASSLLFFCRFGTVNDSNQPVAVPPNIEDHIAVDVIGILEDLPHFRETMPSTPLDDACPGLDLASRFWMFPYRLAQMPAGDDMHSLIVLHIS